MLMSYTGQHMGMYVGNTMITTVLLCNDVSQWLSESLESALINQAFLLILYIPMQMDNLQVKSVRQLRSLIQLTW